MRRSLVLGLLCAAMACVPAGAGAGVVGYLYYTFQPGDNLFANQLHFTNTSTLATDMLVDLFATAPEGTTISLWNPTSSTFTAASTFSGGAWSVNLQLAPGEGVQLHNPSSSSFINTFVGEVFHPDGVTPYNGIDPWIMPSPFTGSAGSYLLGCASPVAFGSSSGDSTAFTYILGRAPLAGEQFTRLDPVSQMTFTTTYAAGGWDNGAPVLAIGDAGFFSIVPEPATLLAFAPLVLLLRRPRQPREMRGTDG